MCQITFCKRCFTVTLLSATHEQSIHLTFLNSYISSSPLPDLVRMCFFFCHPINWLKIIVSPRSAFHSQQHLSHSCCTSSTQWKPLCNLYSFEILTFMVSPERAISSLSPFPTPVTLLTVRIIPRIPSLSLGFSFALIRSALNIHPVRVSFLNTVLLM